MDPIRTGLVGCGKVAEFHALAYQNLPNSEFVACCDSDFERAKAFAKRFGLTPYADVQEMIQKSKVQALSVCTPHPLHAKIAVAAADAGCHVLIEKPLAVSLEDCDTIIESGERNNVQISMIAQKRFYRPCLRMKQAILEGKIGTPIIGTLNMYGWRGKDYYDSDPWRGTWKGEGGGVMATQATHEIDILLWMMGEVDEVYGVWENFNHPYIEVEDTAAAIVRFKSGAIGNLIMSNSQNPGLYGNVHVHGSNGASIGTQIDGGSAFIAGMTTIAEAPYNDIWTIRGEEDRLEEMKAADSKEFLSCDFMHYYHERQIEDFLNAIQQNRTPMVTARDGRRAVELMLAVYKSMELNAPVKLPMCNSDGEK